MMMCTFLMFFVHVMCVSELMFSETERAEMKAHRLSTSMTSYFLQMNYFIPFTRLFACDNIYGVGVSYRRSVLKKSHRC